MPIKKKRISTTGLDGETLNFQLDIWAGQVKQKDPLDLSWYTKPRNKVLATDYPYLLDIYVDFLNLDYRKKKC